MMPESLAAMHIRQMYFQERNRHAGQGITQSYAGMRVSPRINNDEIGAVGARGMDAIYQRPFVVALKARTLPPLRSGNLSQGIVDIGQGLPPVDVRLARAEQVQVRAMQNQYLLRHSW